jgi:OmpA-OmpF porin, OOP family
MLELMHVSIVRRLAFWPSISFVLTCLLLCGVTRADDIEGSSDHPAIGRYDGSDITYYQHSDFDEAALLQSPHDYGALLDANKPKDRNGPEWLKVAGKVTQIRYSIPSGRSSLEVYRNFEAALKSNGFQTSFSCTDQECFVGRMNDPYLLGEQIDSKNGISTAYFDKARYLLAKNANGNFASILVGEDKDKVTAFVEVVESGKMESGKVVGAKDMAASIKASGKIDLYGILFDSAQATIKPDSKATLAEVASLLKSNPQLRLQIIGHTDSVGGADYNMDLSLRRAASVVSALVGQYGITADRLKSSGAGLTMPVASNDTEEGKAKNRRVELKAR